MFGNKINSPNTQICRRNDAPDSMEFRRLFDQVLHIIDYGTGHLLYDEVLHVAGNILAHKGIVFYRPRREGFSHSSKSLEF